MSSTASYQPRSNCAGCSPASPTTPKRASAPGPSPAGRRCRCLKRRGGVLERIGRNGRARRRGSRLLCLLHYLGSFFVSADVAYVLPFRNEVRILLKFLKTWPKTAKAVLISARSPVGLLLGKHHNVLWNRTRPLRQRAIVR